MRFKKIQAVRSNSCSALLIKFEILVKWAQTKHANCLGVALTIDYFTHFSSEIVWNLCCVFYPFNNLLLTRIGRWQPVRCFCKCVQIIHIWHGLFLLLHYWVWRFRLTVDFVRSDIMMLLINLICRGYYWYGGHTTLTVLFIIVIHRWGLQLLIVLSYC